jgi:hypothetical protein
LEGGPGDGIWIPRGEHVDDNTESESDGDEPEESVHSQQTEEQSESEPEEVEVQVAGVGRFDALVLDPDSGDNQGK